ncbi:MAG: glycosyltransferase family 4 protein [Candidatus Electrothrix sp. YB6]
MKVGYFTHTTIFPSETFIYDLIHSLSEINESLVFYCGSNNIKEKSINSIAVGYSDSIKMLPYYGYKIARVFSLNGYLIKFKLQEAIAYSCLKQIKNLPNVAYIDYANSAVLLRKFLVKHGVPYILHVHGYDVTGAVNDPVYKKEVIKTCSDAYAVIAASEHIKRILILIGCNEDKIHVIRYGVKRDHINPLTWLERIKNGPTIISVGRLTAKKNPIALLHAFKIVQKEIPDTIMTIIGDGPLKKEVIKRIDQLGLSKQIRMLGEIGREECFSELNRHWVYAQHSVTGPDGDQEGFAISPAEAALHGLPVVSTWHNGIPEHVIHNKTGILVQEFDYEAMAEAIIRLLRDPELSERMGREGRENITRLCDHKKRVEAIQLLLENALAG